MEKRTLGIIATIVSALACGCAAIIACGWGIVAMTGAPIDFTANGQQSIETLPLAVGYVLLCLSVLFVAVPFVVGFLTLRKKPAPPMDNEPIPPAS